MIKCHECGKEISSTAKVCPQCGAPRKSGSGCLTVILVAVGLLVVLALFGEKSPSEESQEYAIKGACRAKILMSLHDPDSADFEGSGYLSGGGDHWTVVRRVRANNAFGAKRLTTFTCSIKKQGDRWIVDNLSESP